MNIPGYDIRPMRPDELALVLDWAAREGWNPGLRDAACFHAADPQGFWVGLLDGAPIASISVVRYGADYGFLGLYIVVPEHRGKGYGWALWQAGLAHLGGRAVGLDGVVAQQANYRRSGFVLAHRNIRYQGMVRCPAAAGAAEVVELGVRDLEAVLACDAPCFPAGRAAFLRGWIAQPGHHALGWLERGQLRAYGVVRACQSGHKIGPLVAAGAEQAQALLQALMARLPEGAPIFLDVPETNPAAVALAERAGMAQMFETARMYKGAPAMPDLQRTFGIGTFELG